MGAAATSIRATLMCLSRCVTTRLASEPGAESSPQGAADFCLCVVGLSSFISSRSVSACLDLHLTDFSELRGTGEGIALCNCNHVKGKSSHLLNYPVTEEICTAVGGES